MSWLPGVNFVNNQEDIRTSIIHTDSSNQSAFTAGNNEATTMSYPEAPTRSTHKRLDRDVTKQRGPSKQPLPRVEREMMDQTVATDADGEESTKMKAIGVLVAAIQEDDKRLDSLEEENQRLREETQQLTRKANFVEHQLHDCQAEIFRMQPQGCATDTEILEKYDNISQLVGQWVAHAVAETDHNRTRLVNSSLQGNQIPSTTQSLCTEFPAAMEFVLKNTIFGHLQKSILTNDRRLPGMDQAVESLIDHFERGESEEQLKSGEHGRWMSVFMQRVQELPGFNKALEEEMESLVLNLQLDLICVAPSIFDLNTHLERDLYSLIEAAISFARLLKSCPTRYRFEPFLPNFSPKIDYGFVLLDHIEKWSLRDIRTGKLVTSAKQVFATSDKRIGNLVTFVEPSLERVDNWRLLRRSVALVNLFRPLTKGARTERSGKQIKSGRDY